jgi:rod shape-determining protein MreD
VIVTRRIAVRIALAVLVGVILQVSFFSYLSFLGASPDVLTVLVASIGLLGGALVGAVTGFAAGLLLDSSLLQVLGVSSLAMMAAGYLTGRYRETFAIEGRLRPALVIGGATLIATAIFAALQIMLGVTTQVSLLVFREIFVKGLLGGLLAFAVFPLTRRIFRGALVDEARPGTVRERAPVTATASPPRRSLRRRAGRRRPEARSVSRVGGSASR